MDMLAGAALTMASSRVPHPPLPFSLADLRKALRINKYFKEFPTPKQAAFLLLPQQEAFFGGAGGPGKQLCLDTPLATPDGWTLMGDIVPGQQVFDERGHPCTVLAVSAIAPRPESYRLTFDDGSRIDACADHEWVTFDQRELSALTQRDPEWRARRRATRASRAVEGATGLGSGRGHAAKPWLAARNRVHTPPTLPPPTGTIRTTRTIYETLLAGKRQNTNHAIQVAGALELPEQSLLIDPYCLGSWLGDGTAAGGGFTGIDAAIWERFTEVGYRVTHGPARTQSHYVQGLVGHLRHFGLLKNKHVPAVYLRGSRLQRLELLRGLMDTDGTVDRGDGHIEFTNTNRRLAEAVYELVVSLGWKTRLVEGRAYLYGKDCGPKYRLQWTPDAYVFALPRKRDLQRLSMRRTTRFRYIVGCEPIAPTPMRCIAVDSPSHCYLAGRSMIPTHNSSALLMGALQDVHIPGYAALILRRSYTDLALPGALMDRAHDWLDDSDAHWSSLSHTWTFPSTATLTFGYLENEKAKERYRSAEFAYIAYDELTQFLEPQYLFLFSRLRRNKNFPVRLRMRSASNPGGPGHLWVRDRFIIDGKDNNRPFIPARLRDNPYLDIEAYRQSLSHLDPLTRLQIEEGDWDALGEGELFKRHWFKIVDDWPRDLRLVRFWDLAATEDMAGTDPDWTAGALVGYKDGQYWILDMRHERLSPKKVEDLIAQTAALDGRKVDIWIEQEPGASGVAVIDHYQRHVLPGYTVRGLRPSGPKTERARPLSSAAEAGNVFMLRGRWNTALLDELTVFPIGPHDDQVDSISGAVSVFGVPKGRVAFL